MVMLTFSSWSWFLHLVNISGHGRCGKIGSQELATSDMVVRKSWDDLLLWYWMNMYGKLWRLVESYILQPFHWPDFLNYQWGGVGVGGVFLNNYHPQWKLDMHRFGKNPSRNSDVASFYYIMVFWLREYTPERVTLNIEHHVTKHPWQPTNMEPKNGWFPLKESPFPRGPHFQVSSC